MRVAGLLLLLTSCEFRNIEIKGTAPGMENATVSITGGGRDNTLFADNIVDGKFSIPQQPIESPGYYRLNVTTSGFENRFRSQRYEVYLEPGKYNIAIDTGAKPRYPIITSSSSIQNDLTVYHRFTDSVMRGIKEEYNKWLNKFNDPKAMLLPDNEYQDVLAEVKLWQDKSATARLTTLNEFVSKYPNNKVIPHAMSKMGLEQDAAKFFDVYQKLGDDIKTSEDGKKIGDQLKSIVKLLPGSVAPQLEGLTPDGKKIKLTDLHTRLIIVEFWVPGYYSISRGDHKAIINNLLPSLDSKKVKIISVAIDTDRDKWLKRIKEDKLSWLQVSDMKGDDSPNVKNWNLNTLPVYYILNGNTGKIIYANLTYQEMALSIEEYFRAHP